MDASGDGTINLEAALKTSMWPFSLRKMQNMFGLGSCQEFSKLVTNPKLNFWMSQLEFLVCSGILFIDDIGTMAKHGQREGLSQWCQLHGLTSGQSICTNRVGTVWVLFLAGYLIWDSFVFFLFFCFFLFSWLPGFLASWLPGFLAFGFLAFGFCGFCGFHGFLVSWLLASWLLGF